MTGQCKTAGTGNAWTKRQFTKTLPASLKKGSQSFLDVCIMSFVIGKQDVVVFIDDCDFNGCGTDIDSKSVNLIHTTGVISPYLLCGVIPKENPFCIINM